MFRIRSPFSARLTTLPAYDQTATEVAFLLGGIGTGNVSVGSRGQLKDWEIFNHPDKGRKFPYTFFAVHTQCQGDIQNRKLEGPLMPPYSSSHGLHSAELGGLAHMQVNTLRAEYPLCMVHFEDDKLPVDITLEAYTPFIPLEAEDSGIPGTIIRYRVKNTAGSPAFVSIVGSITNMTTAQGVTDLEYVRYHGETKNTVLEEDGLHGIHMTSVNTPAWHPMHAGLALCTTGDAYTVKPNFLMGTWWDGPQDFWDDFCTDGRLTPLSAQGGRNETIIMNLDQQHTGALAVEHTLQPGEEYVYEFILTWYFPNRKKAWFENYDPKTIAETETIRNHYALRYSSAWDVARALADHMERLERDTMLFHDAFFSSTLPTEILDAASANITVLRSTTCFWLENDLFMGWEGTFDTNGCCLGNCTHVWNYEQTLAYLFPELEQSMRRTEFMWETDADGCMHFRALRMLEGVTWDLPPATDGQLGAIVRLWRDYRLSGNPKLLDEMGDAALRALDFSITHWDADGDGVLDSQQHNTYDIEFCGINSMTNSMLYAALQAGAEIARVLGQPARAQQYLALCQQGSAKMDALLWNGEYYEQRVDDVEEYKYQFGKGVLSDQLLGQYAAFMAGLGYILPKEHVDAALLSIHHYNFCRKVGALSHIQRTYAIGDEPGLLLCSWPRGGRPRFPFIYSDEVWTGIEYQVAATLLYAGHTAEALEIVQAARSRYNGHNRNPFDEVECGHHYVRSMASWGLMLGASGFSCQPDGSVAFSPRFSQDDFRCFYSTGSQWGVLTQQQDAKGRITQQITPLFLKSQE